MDTQILVTQILVPVIIFLVVLIAFFIAKGSLKLPKDYYENQKLRDAIKKKKAERADIADILVNQMDEEEDGESSE